MENSFLENELLFSYDRTEKIIAVEYDGDNGMDIFLRVNGHIRKEKEAFRPFILLTNQTLLQGMEEIKEIVPLNGNHEFKYLVFYKHWKKRDHILKVLKNAAQPPEAVFLNFPDPVHQHLLLTGKTLFKGLSFEEINRMQIDIETFCDPEYEFSNPHRDSDRITMIAISDNRGFEYVISGKRLDESEMLKELVRIINEKDPDIIEGHNINKFDLWYIEKRAKKLKIPLKLGRDGSLLRSHPSRFSIAERNINFPKYEIYGRHIVDTWILAQLYDVSYRGLENYRLKEIARHFSVVSRERTYIQPSQISWYFLNDPETLRKYALDDVRETRSISDILSYPYFIQAQMFPYSYQNVIVRGNATRIDSLFIREYLRQLHSIPRPSPQISFEGGYADIFYQGVLHNIIHCDVQSLYPSIMLSFQLFPQKDELQIFARLLKDLRQFRLKAKSLMREAREEKLRKYYDALQGTFKILINSFYGYLGFSLGHFSDFERAGQVTKKGREILSAMIEKLKASGYIIAEIDTDGIYFSPPKGKEDFTEQGVLQELSAILPEGIQVEIDGTYRSMFSYKIKNYVLMDHNQNITVKGSGLKSRGLELFQRKFMEDMFRLILSGESEKINDLYTKYKDDLCNHRLPVEMFCKTETLQESPLLYQEKVRKKERNASAAYELALKSGNIYVAGDQISYYVTGNKKNVKVFDNCKLAHQWDPENPDENVNYYNDKLDALYQKFKPFIT